MNKEDVLTTRCDVRREGDGQTVNAAAEDANLGTVPPLTMSATPSGCT